MKEIPVSITPNPAQATQGGCDNSNLLAGLLTLEQARTKMLQSITPITDSIEVGIMDSYGSIVAENITSPINVPNYKNSAMDGYAVSAHDLPEAEPKKFKLIGNYKIIILNLPVVKKLNIFGNPFFFCFYGNSIFEVS